MTCHNTDKTTAQMKRMHEIIEKHLDQSAKGSIERPEWWKANQDHLNCMNEKMTNGAAFAESHQACENEGHVFYDFNTKQPEPDARGEYMYR